MRSPTFRILDVGGGRVLGVELDDMDVESVVTYELVEKHLHHPQQARAMKFLIQASPTIPRPLLLLALATTQACGVDTPTEEALQAAVTGALDSLVAQIVADPPADAAGYADRLRTYLEAHPAFYGSAAALLDESGTVTASPYVHRTDDGYQTLNLVSPDYNIEEQDWVTMPLAENASIWTSPYFDAGGGEIWMITRSVSARDGGRTFAIITTDLPVDAPGDAAIADDVPVQIEDSAGARIVTYERTPTAPSAFRLSAAPRYRHGANPGDYAIQEVSLGRLLPDGSAVIHERWNVELVVLGQDGATYDVLAAQGEGPGEVDDIHALFVLGDSILAVDLNRERMTLFAGDSVARTTNVRVPTYLGVKGIGSPGELLLATYWGPSDFDQAWLLGHMVRFGMETGTLDTVASYDFAPRIPPGLEWDWIKTVGEVTVATGQFVHVRTDRAEVTWRLPDGTVTQIVRWPAEPTLLTELLLGPIEAAHRREVHMRGAGTSDAEIAEIIRRNMADYRASIGRPLPLFASPLADDGGRVWLPSYKAGRVLQGAPPYTVIGPDGVWLGTVEAPPGFRLLDVAGGLVLGVELDEMDVESVVVYELVGR